MDLAMLIKERTGSASEIRTIPFEEAYDENFEDLARRVPNLSRIRSVIDYRPRLGVEEIVDKVIEHMRQEIA